jgi:ATP-dependent DNA helicase RecQ
LLYDEQEIRELEQLPALRYPSLDDIKLVYQAIANYLQLAAGAGEGQYFDFDINDFLKKFKLNGHTTTYSLKALEQEGWLQFNEQVFLPTIVKFTSGKTELYEFEKNYPLLEPIIKTLLRVYEGVFDYPSPVSEMVVARLLRKDVDNVKDELRQLHHYGMIEYQPQKDSPQLFFPRSRIRVEELSINKTNYGARKEKLAARVRQMIRFVQTTTECRSKMIGVYFGDEAMNDCGICDNCLRKKNDSLSQEEFENIHNSIVATLRDRSLQAKELLSALGSIKKEKAWKVIEFLQAENKIEMDESGKINLSRS